MMPLPFLLGLHILFMYHAGRMAIIEAATVAPQVAQVAQTTSGSFPDWINWVTPVVSLIAGAVGGFCAAWVKIDRCAQSIVTLKEEKEKTTVKLDGLRTDVDTLKEFKVSAQKFIDKQLYKEGSPLELTELGKALVTDSGFTTIFEQVKSDLAGRLLAKNPRTQYDVQEMARELMDSLTEYAAFAPIKTYAFSNGKDLSQILRAGALMLRDYYLSLHPEIKE